jgi:ssDNA-binding replication factor A large subunit
MIHIVSIDERTQSWGRGETLKQADANLKRAGGSVSKDTTRILVVWDWDEEHRLAEENEGPYIDAFGTLYAPGEIIATGRI